MKLIHTSDWHLGKIIHEVNLLEDQGYILDRLLDLIDEERPDVLLISGDLYDRSVPSKEAVNLLDSILYELVMVKKIKVIAIAGNHDSGDRIDFASRILTKNGLYIKGKQNKEIEKISIDDEYGRVNFYLLPFCDVATMRYQFEDDEINSFDRGYEAIINRIKDEMNPDERNIVLAHGFIINLGENEDIIPDESVRPLSIGNTEYVNVNCFEGFDYVALGHLHKPSKVKTKNIRYSGSLMKYSFSEHNQKKGVNCIELREKGDIDIDFKPLIPMRDIKIIKGKMEELIAPSYYKRINHKDYLKVILTDENPIYDAYSMLKGIYPNILTMEYINTKINSSSGVTIHDIKRKKNDVDLFEDFYVDMTGKDFTEEKKKIVEGIFEGLI